MSEIFTYTKSADLLADSKQIIEVARNYAYRSVNIAMVQRNWLLGKRISEEFFDGNERAEYNDKTIKTLSKELTSVYGKGFTKSSLYSYVQFFKMFPQIFQTLSGKSQLLTWSHYSLLSNVENDEARQWYAGEACNENWSVRTLRRNIASQCYFRMLMSQTREPVRDEMKQLTASMQGDKLEFIKNPVVAEFLGFAPNAELYETQLETSIITHLQKFIMEMGKGFAFVARQQLIRTSGRWICMSACTTS